MNETLKADLGKALSYFKARMLAVQVDEYVAAADIIIALKEECKSNAAFSKVLEEEGFTEEILSRNERSCITGWFADLSTEQRERVIAWMKEREQNGYTFKLQTAERHFVKTFNDEDEEEDQAPPQAAPRSKKPVVEDDPEDDEEGETVEQLHKNLADLKARYTELEQKLARMTKKDNDLANENKALKARVKELEALVQEHVIDAMNEPR